MLPSAEPPRVRLFHDAAARLLMSDMREISGVRCRVLCYLLSYSKAHLIYVAVNRLLQIRCSYVMALQPVLDSIGVTYQDVAKDRKALKEIARQVSHFLRFSFELEGQRALCLPYYNLKIVGQAGPDETPALNE
jgi:hypothetical protein